VAFIIEQFPEVIESYNRAIYPFQWVIFILAGWAGVMRGTHRLLGASLMSFWTAARICLRAGSLVNNYS
jgi:hypothetical protein